MRRIGVDENHVEVPAQTTVLKAVIEHHNIGTFIVSDPRALDAVGAYDDERTRPSREQERLIPRLAHVDPRSVPAADHQAPATAPTVPPAHDGSPMTTPLEAMGDKLRERRFARHPPS